MIILTGSLIPELLAPKDFPGVQPIFSSNLKPLFFVGIGLKYSKGYNYNLKVYVTSNIYSVLISTEKYCTIKRTDYKLDTSIFLNFNKNQIKKTDR